MLENSVNYLNQAEVAAQVKSVCACSLLVFMPFTYAVCSVLVAAWRGLPGDFIHLGLIHQRMQLNMQVYSTDEVLQELSSPRRAMPLPLNLSISCSPCTDCGRSTA